MIDTTTKSSNVGDPLDQFAAVLSENKCSLLLLYVMESPGDLMKDDTASDLEWPLKVISGTALSVCHNTTTIQWSFIHANAGGW